MQDIIVYVNEFLSNFNWYGFMYFLSFLFIYFYHSKYNKDLFKNINLDDYLFISFIFLIIGGRIGYCLIYNFEYFFSNPIQILMIWNGGMSFHGALISLILFNVFYLKYKKINFFNFTNKFIVPFPIALFLGRIGNYTNGELWGRVTEVPWCMYFEGVEGCRHPSQLYEAFFEGLILFFILLYFKKVTNNKYMCSLFVFFYAVFRFFIEFFRSPDSHIGLYYGLSLGQFLCISMIFLSIVLCFLEKKDSQKNFD